MKIRQKSKNYQKLTNLGLQKNKVFITSVLQRKTKGENISSKKLNTDNQDTQIVFMPDKQIEGEE